MFGDIYKGKKVLVTGNTGFKGSWLTTWLMKLGAKVYGLSNTVLTEPAMYGVLNLENRIEKQYWVDIRNKDDVKKVFAEVRPDFVFHLAAQAIVSTSYSNPFDTITTNVAGTASILDAIRDIVDWNMTAVLITSDKAYDNVEWIWGYRENDAMGGKDVYSGSKGAAELVIKSYWHSFIKKKANIMMGIARAGNVIGGGDWSADRIVVDTVKAFSEGRAVEIRSPKATRPWQHVLEPLGGYLRLGQSLADGSVQNGEAFNFGPRAEQTKTVKQLVEDIARRWGMNAENCVKVTGQIPFNEATLLKLNCDKALAYLGWHSTLVYRETVEFVTDWYKKFYNGDKDLYEMTVSQIDTYVEKAINQELAWTE